MLKRITALCLALSMALSLAACGGKQSSSEGDGSSSAPVKDKTYASDSAMDVFDAIQAIKDTKDCTFQYQENILDADSGEVSQTKYSLSGAWYASTKQAYIEVTMAGQSLTRFVIDGNTLYVDAVSAANGLASLFTALGDEDYADYAEDLQADAEAFSTDYLSFTLAEDPWATREGDSFAALEEEVQSVLTAVKKDAQDKVTQEDSTCSLTLGLGDLQDVLLIMTDSLVENKASYQDFLSAYLTENFESFLEAAGWSVADYLDTKWAAYEELNTDMNSLEAEESWNDWTMKLVACGDETSGYTLDFYDYDYKSANYCLTVVPADASAVDVPEESTDHEDFNEQLGEVYSCVNIYNNLAYDDDTDDYSDYYDDADGSADAWEDEEDLEVLDEIETAAITGYKNIVSTEMVTDDGVSVTVPVLAKYDTVEAGENSAGVNDVFLNTDGYVLQYINIDGQEAESFTKENVDMYVSAFSDDWGYEITQQASEVVQSADGSVTAAGLGYDDTDEEQEITIITGCIQPTGSSYLLGFDLFLYSESVTNQEITAVKELFDYWGMDVPVNLVKN